MNNPSCFFTVILKIFQKNPLRRILFKEERRKFPRLIYVLNHALCLQSQLPDHQVFNDRISLRSSATNHKTSPLFRGTTTLLDHEKYDWTELAVLYAQRWDIELRLRDVKTTLEMDHMRVKTPATARKTLRMALIAYNLIKSSCQEAGPYAGKDLRLMSFKGALDTIVANTSRYLRRQRHVMKIQEIWTSTIEMIAQKSIHLRPHQHEPRAQKKRPKSFSYLTKPRAEYQEIPHRGKHRSYA